MWNNVYGAGQRAEGVTTDTTHGLGQTIKIKLSNFARISTIFWLAVFGQRWLSSPNLSASHRLGSVHFSDFSDSAQQTYNP